jgi:hypothetical protein
MKSNTPQVEYDPSQPRLREIVLVNVTVPGEESFDALLTRVPGIGEEIAREDRSYKITRVQHMPVDRMGRAEFGWHAFLDAELLPPEEEEAKHKKRKRPR